MNAPTTLATKPFTWSFSALDSYEICPKRYWEISLAKRVDDRTTEIGNWGKDAHKAIELRIRNKKPLPPGMRQFEPFVSRLIKAPGETYAEQKIALTRDYKPVDYFGREVWLRTQIDAAKHNGSHVAIIDWKFGKLTDETKWRTQGLVMTAAILAQMPEVKTVRYSFVWWREAALGVPPVTTGQTTREDFWTTWMSVIRRVEKMEEAVKNTDFPATPNFLCRKHCAVKSCPYNGA